MNINQLLAPTEAARLKGMTLNRFKYQIAKPNAPKPILIGVHEHPYYDRDEIKLWRPTRRSKK